MIRNATFLVFLTLSVGCGGNTQGPIGNARNVTNTGTPAPTSQIRPTSKASFFQFRDLETGSTWNFKGEAIQGQFAGEKLDSVVGYNAFWFAWASFWPTTAVWGEFPVSEGLLPSSAFQDIPESEIKSNLSIDSVVPLDNPPDRFGSASFVGPTAATDLAPEELVLGVVLNGDARAYPVKILNWHEIVNHAVGGRQISLTYSPLTASAINFDTPDLAFGNSGALYNNNLVMYDRETGSFWSQMRMNSIFGTRRGQPLEVLPVVQCTWAAWRTLYPFTSVLSPNTGVRAIGDYMNDLYIEGGYNASSNLYINQTPAIDPRYHPKTRVYGLVGNTHAKAYPLSSLGEKTAINDSFEGQPILLLYEQSAQMAVVYSRYLGGNTLTFERIE